MAFQLSPLSTIRIHPASFMAKFNFGDTIDERGYVAQVVRRANNSQCRLHVLHDQDRNYAFAAISLSQFSKRPAIVLDYLFASSDQRRLRHQHLGEITAAEYLLQYCLQQARSINDLVPVDYFTLEAADDRLVKYYRDKDFELVTKTRWMFISV